MKQAIIATLLQQRLLPLFYESDLQKSIGVLRALYQAGIRVVEYTNRGAQALSNFKALQEIKQAEMPDLHLGIGTVKSTREAEDFTALGADFIVCPVVNPLVAEWCEQHQLLWIPGCMTPTEIYTAQQSRAAIIKIFPANVLGPSFIAAVKDLFPGQLFIPTGGVEIEKENLKKWFDAGVCAVGMGSGLIKKEFLDQEDYEGIQLLSKKALSIINSIPARPFLLPS